MKRVVLLAILLTAGAAARDARPADWRAVIRPNDRTRLREWRDTWTAALAAARAGGAGAQIAAAGVLLEPDAALPDPALPDGLYRCRVVKLGAKTAGGLAYVDYPNFACRVNDGRFVKLDGSQRPAGRLWPMDEPRLVFLGAMALGDETRTLDYGRDAERDMVGVVERIGPRRWRLVLPRPRWESLLDVVELVPR